MSKLSPNVLKSLPPGLHNDGDGLYLMVSKRTNKAKERHRSWIFRYRVSGRKSCRDMGLGRLSRIGLSAARELARDASVLLQQGKDPIEARRQARGVARDQDEKTRMTFKRTVTAFITQNKPKWDAGYANKWEANFVNHVFPVIGNVAVNTVDISHVKQALDPLWHAKPVLARMLQQRMETVLDWAAVSKYRQGENPARWQGYLEHHYGKAKPKTEHQPSLPYQGAPTFMKKLQADKGVPSFAFQFLILTAMRSTEVLEARWPEIDTKAGVWTVPSERMKMDRDHTVPLSAPALRILKEMQKIRCSDYVFPGAKPNQPRSEGSLLTLKNKLGYHDTTPHGWRATFRSWADDETSYDHDIKEMALAHSIGSGTEAAYRRTTMFKKRKAMMDDWAAFLGGTQVQQKVAA